MSRSGSVAFGSSATRDGVALAWLASPAGFESSENGSIGADSDVSRPAIAAKADARSDAIGTDPHATATIASGNPLERALLLAAEAGRFDVVAKLADELQARRVTAAGNVVVIDPKRRQR